MWVYPALCALAAAPCAGAYRAPSLGVAGVSAEAPGAVPSSMLQRRLPTSRIARVAAAIQALGRGGICLGWSGACV